MRQLVQRGPGCTNWRIPSRAPGHSMSSALSVCVVWGVGCGRVSVHMQILIEVLLGTKPPSNTIYTTRMHMHSQTHTQTAAHSSNREA
jgi:hypothetical protein